MTTEPHSRSLRKGRFSEPDRIYHVRATTLQRQAIFNDLLAARILINSLRREQELEYASTLAFVVMPDHLHWLMQLGEKATLSQVVGRVKSVTAHRLGSALWQEGFFDHALRREEDVRVLASYIIANPLRAGLVTQIGDYPHWYVAWM